LPELNSIENDIWLNQLLEEEQEGYGMFALKVVRTPAEAIQVRI
jgi:hypothetical protein